MTNRFVNITLLLVLIILGLSGLVMLYGTWQPWIFDLHRIAGFALLALFPWKLVIILRSLRRGLRKTLSGNLDLLISITFALLILFVIIMGISWLFRLGPYSSFGQTLVAWHWIVGILAIPALAYHAWRHWPRLIGRDLTSRRAFLRYSGMAGFGLLFGIGATRIAEARSVPGNERRFTGSRGFGHFEGNVFPVTGERSINVAAETWRLSLTGAVSRPLSLSYDEILTRPSRCLTAIIDCTNGWFSAQDWCGLALMDLLEEAGLSGSIKGVRLTSATGYNHTYPLVEARHILLATHVGEEVLSIQHGFPLRAVVPGRRGWFWVKWLTQIYVLDSTWDVFRGMLGSPLQTLRQF